jgi:hypothetical protein
MGTFDAFITPEAGAQRRIDPTKVLIICNSNPSRSALSSQVADYYQQARGLTDHRLSFDLGTGYYINQASRYQDFILPVADYIQQNGIECVLLSAGTAAGFHVSDAAGYGADICAAHAFGAAVAWKKAGAIQRYTVNSQSAPDRLGEPYLVIDNTGQPLGYSSIGNPLYEPKDPNGYAWRFAKTINMAWLKQAPDYIPCGIIGNPRLWFPGDYPAESFDEVKRIIDDAVWAAQQTGPKQISIQLGGSSTITPIRQEWQWMAFKLFEAAGHAVDYLVSSWGNTGVDQSWFGEAARWSYANVRAGTELWEADGYLGASVSNLAIGDVYANSLVPKRGAFGYETLSFGQRFGANLIIKGGCAALGSFYEPLSNGLGDVASFATLLLRGWSIAEAGWLISPTPWMVGAFGDPLYRPFPAVGLPTVANPGITPKADSVRRTTVLDRIKRIVDRSKRRGIRAS